MIRKALTYFLTVNGGISITVALVSSQSLLNFSEKKEKNLILIISKDSKEIKETKKSWEWDDSKKVLIFFKKNIGIWNIKLFSEENTYKEWIKEKISDEDFTSVIFSFNKKDWVPKFLSTFSSYTDYSEFALSAQFENSKKDFDENFGPESYEKLMSFIKKDRNK